MPPASDAVSFYAVESPRVVKNLYEQLSKEQDKIILALGAGHCMDWPDYKYKTGIIRGLGTAMTMIEEMEKEERGR